MTELDRELRALAALAEFPAERDLWPSVHARLGERPRRSRLKVDAVALAATVAAIGIAFAVPSARSAILRFFGLEHVSIVRVDSLPRGSGGLAVHGTPTTLHGAFSRLGFEPLLPDIDPPSAVYLDRSLQAVLLLYGKPARVRLEETRSGIFGKVLFAGQDVEGVTVNGGRGIWVVGRHVFNDFFGQPRISGSALIWEQGAIGLRLNGPLTRAQALRIVRSVRG